MTYKFDEVISPCAFPDSLLDELVLGIAPVTVSVANGDSSRHASFTRLVDSGSEPFVFLRNRKIASEIGGEPCEVKLALEISDVPQKEKKILFFSDASHWTRRWPSRRWMELSRMLPNGFEAVSAPMGRTLSEFTRFVASCAAVVSNDTMAFHVASALDIPAIGITNGVSGRDSFWPYPSVLGKKSVACVPERLPKIPIPLLGSRLSQYLALSSVSAKSVADGLKSILA
ncbi:MAG: hypothetical protein IKO72_05235 [Kiritimatiellae bacterium]|nr:hypothetical protein [Kiritimatiellia bacterium]